MSDCRVIVLTVLSLVLCAGLGRAREDRELPLLPDRLAIGNTTYAVVPVPAGRSGERPSAVPEGYRFPKGKPVADLNEVLRYWFEGDEFLRSPCGKSAVPFDGAAPFVGYISLAEKKLVAFENAFPHTGEKRGDTESRTRYEWTGVSRPAVSADMRRPA